VYATCLFCNAPFARNESLEAFPVGTRLAFDAARGRLWVVCAKCERWSLSPLDERWEAIEQAERLYRDTRKRVATDNVGLAKLRDGTTLVRIGEPLRPEFAAWRYGDQFGRRRRRQILLTGGGMAAVGALAMGGALAGVGVGGFAYGLMEAVRAARYGRANTIVANIRADDGMVMPVRRRHLAESVLSQTSDGEVALDLRFKNGGRHFEGPEARRITAIVVPKVNRFGGSAKDVANAVHQIENVGTAGGFLRELTKSSHVITRPMQPRKSRWRGRPEFNKWGLFALPAPQRLALEMALHEEAERRALEGELSELERAWREAEEVASISDNLLVPASIDAELERMRKEGARRAE
jgi:hypothetical protein